MWRSSLFLFLKKPTDQEQTLSSTQPILLTNSTYMMNIMSSIVRIRVCSRPKCMDFLIKESAPSWELLGPCTYISRRSVLIIQSLGYCRQIRFTFKMASHRSEDFCDESTIASGQLLGEDNDEDDFWYCIDCPQVGLQNPCTCSNGGAGSGSGHGADIQLAPTLYPCTSFSADEDWAAGENVFTVVFPEVGIYDIV